MINKLKVVWQGKRLKDVYVGASKWQVFKYRVSRFFRNVLKVLIIGSLASVAIFGAIFYGKSQVPTIIYAVQEKGTTPVLDRIAKCESGGSQYDKNGQVIVKANTNGSVDIGRYQINLRIWGAKAKELGLDLSKEKDNETFALWLYENKGTGDWAPSYKCWAK